jgi:isoamylase
MKKVQGTPIPLGVTVGDSKINFSVSVPRGRTCELLLYQAGQCKPQYVFLMPEEEAVGEVRFLALEKEEVKGYEYNYRIDQKVWIDPYVRELTGHSVFGRKEDLDSHKIRGRFWKTDFDWEEDRQLNIPCHEVIAYSLHVRGFTMHSSAKVKHGGTFTGLVEKLPYLKELGVNQIQCMPVYEFEESAGTRQNYWGYGKGYYFAPKAVYGTTDCVRTEFKNMVKTFHKEGIEIILEMPFEEQILPQVVVECLQYYMQEYHIDGFIVNPLVVPWDGLINDPLLKGMKIWKKDDDYQNVMRRFLKGDEGMVNQVIQAFQYNTREKKSCSYITAHTGFTLYDLVSYDEKHNEANGEYNKDGPEYNYSWNCGAEGPSRKQAVTRLREKQIRNAFFLLLTSQGTPCVLAGDEFENTQMGNNNVYCQDNELSWLDWNKLRNNDLLFRYVKSLIMIRKDHSVFHQMRSLSGLDQTACGIPDVSYHGKNAWQVPAEVSSRQLGVLYCGKELNDTDCFVAYNMHWIEHSFALPSSTRGKKWYQIADTSAGVLKEPLQLENQKKIDIKERTIVLLIGIE